MILAASGDGLASALGQGKHLRRAEGRLDLPTLDPLPGAVGQPRRRATQHLAAGEHRPRARPGAKHSGQAHAPPSVSICGPLHLTTESSRAGFRGRGRGGANPSLCYTINAYEGVPGCRRPPSLSMMSRGSEAEMRLRGRHRQQRRRRALACAALPLILTSVLLAARGTRGEHPSSSFVSLARTAFNCTDNEYSYGTRCICTWTQVCESNQCWCESAVRA